MTQITNDRLAAMVSEFEFSFKDRAGCTLDGDEAQEVHDALLDLQSRRSASNTGGVEVKALTWIEVNGPDGVWWRADNPIGGLPFEVTSPEEREHVEAKYRSRILSAISLAAEAEPVAEWGDAKTVGNLIAQLRTFDPSTPIHGAFHADAGDGRKARIRGLTLSRERVNGRLIDTGNVTVPYAIVAWSAPELDPETHPSSPVSAEVTEAMVDRFATYMLEGEWVRDGDVMFPANRDGAQGIDMRAALVATMAGSAR